jgi:hypothetical protein
MTSVLASIHMVGGEDRTPVLDIWRESQAGMCRSQFGMELAIGELIDDQAERAVALWRDRQLTRPWK